MRIVRTGLLLGAALLGLAGGMASSMAQEREAITVGFIYNEDEQDPYTYNFVRSEQEMVEKFGSKVRVEVRKKVDRNQCEEILQSLIASGCDLVIANSYDFGPYVKQAAALHKKIEFCQATGDNANVDPIYPNYHTFMGEIYQGRYITGVIAGMKLKAEIAAGRLTPEQVIVGYVGAFPNPEVISGYTAFFLGVLSEIPAARMKVLYTMSWSDYNTEKTMAHRLINDEGAVLISQHSDTFGPAVACEEELAKNPDRVLYHVGYNRSMITVAPQASLIASRINWSPYILGAAEAVLSGQPLEKSIKGHVHGSNDMSAGFDEGWVEMLELNAAIAAPGSAEKVASLIEGFKKGEIEVFKGDYEGVNRTYVEDKIGLKEGFEENSDRSAPEFYYRLNNITELN